MVPESENVGQAASAAAEAASLAVQAEIQHERTVSSEIIEAISETATERVENAEAAAQAVMDAAIMTSLGQRQSALENEVRTWLEARDAQISALETLLSSLAAEMQAIREATALSLGMQISSAPVQSSLIQPQSPETIAAEIVEPNLFAAAVVDSPVPLTPERRKARLI
jgi:hypothetical protein